MLQLISLCFVLRCGLVGNSPSLCGLFLLLAALKCAEGLRSALSTERIQLFLISKVIKKFFFNLNYLKSMLCLLKQFELLPVDGHKIRGP